MREATRLRVFSDEELATRRARAYVAQYIKRRKLKKPLGCERCPSIETPVAVWSDPRKPLEVQWLCTNCRHNEYADRTATRRNANAIAADFEAIKALPREMQERLHAEAQTGLGGPPGTLRYAIALKLAYRNYCSP